MQTLGQHEAIIVQQRVAVIVHIIYRVYFFSIPLKIHPTNIGSDLLPCNIYYSKRME